MIGQLRQVCHGPRFWQDIQRFFKFSLVRESSVMDNSGISHYWFTAFNLICFPKLTVPHTGCLYGINITYHISQIHIFVWLCGFMTSLLIKIYNVSQRESSCCHNIVAIPAENIWPWFHFTSCELRMWRNDSPDVAQNQREEWSRMLFVICMDALEWLEALVGPVTRHIHWWVCLLSQSYFRWILACTVIIWHLSSLWFNRHQCMLYKYWNCQIVIVNWLNMSCCIDKSPARFKSPKCNHCTQSAWHINASDIYPFIHQWRRLLSKVPPCTLGEVGGSVW